MKRSSATLERSSLAERRQFRWATSEHVVYAYRHGASPAITYHSVPHACAGGAATLDEARKSYRSSMAEKLGVGQRKLPPVVEHLEAVVAGMWVRDKIGAVRRAAADDRMLLQALLADGPIQSLGAHIECAASRGAKAVVVIVEPDDTVGSVLDQMRTEDVLVVVHRDAETIARWVALYGPDAKGVGNAARVRDNIGLRALPVRELTQTSRPIHIVSGPRGLGLPDRQR
jgi:hypothetical protein